MPENNTTHQQYSVWLQKLTEFVRPGAEQAARFEQFCQRLLVEYAMGPDLPEDAEVISQGMASLWRLALQRDKDCFKLQLGNFDKSEPDRVGGRSYLQLVSRDRPFLVQSLLSTLKTHGFSSKRLVHPLILIQRDRSGQLLGFCDKPSDDAVLESLISIEFDPIDTPEQNTALENDLVRVLEDVRVVTDDWNACLQRLEEIAGQLTFPVEQDCLDSQQFLRWLADDHFIFLGYRRYRLKEEGALLASDIIPGTGTGLLRDERAPLRTAPGVLSAANTALFRQPQPLLISKATSRSRVHRAVYMDYVGIKEFDVHGRVIGEHRFLGLYSSTVYHCAVRSIPLLRQKIQRVLVASGFSENSYNGRTFYYVIEDLPREELFYASEEELLEITVGVMRLLERPDVGVFFRQDSYAQMVSVLVFVPRERYHTHARQMMQQILQRAFDSDSSDFSVQMGESSLARVQFTLHPREGLADDVNLEEIRQAITAVFKDWQDGLYEQLVITHGKTSAAQLYRRFRDAFDISYRSDFSARQALVDIDALQKLPETTLQIRFYQDCVPTEQARTLVSLYCLTQPAALSDTLPILENLGLRVINQHPYQVSPAGLSASCWIHQIEVQYPLPGVLEMPGAAHCFEEAFTAIWFNQCDNDRLNQLVFSASLGWQQIALFRGLFYYARQLGQWFSLEYVSRILLENSTAVQGLWQLFSRRFDPDSAVVMSESALIQSINQSIDNAAALDDERILKRYLELVCAMVRTNYFSYRSDEQGVPYLAFKFDPERISDLPLPVPAHEIFVYSVKFEGVHLRAGDVARGGLRWSDRREDFRTEILGLMKAQVNKNAVIVPTGAKGGFVIKVPLDAMLQSETQRTLQDCYRSFIRGLLDLTDNLGRDGVCHKPARLVCHDTDDAYLVVAADKGTASLSDVANAEAISYDFWLGDAFASGGSVGYDHKKMGITARGAWESIKHHFLSMNRNIQQEGLSVVGIGDMSGDVFGNGMLMTPEIRLVAAFNHKHIFLDPDPSPRKAFQERKRLFQLPRSDWSDYAQSCLSAGGGIYSRNAKSIAVSEEVQQILGINVSSLKPDELIRCLLKAPVDLLWNGGIGTYVRASDELDADVGDRSNDRVRIRGCDLRCKVVGEGGNLGLTQAARVEFALNGGIINTDAIDNSAGVDCSDHEVNIKILLGRLLAQGALAESRRAEVLAGMTDEVAQLVLKHNYQQTRAISLVEEQVLQSPESHFWLIDQLESLTHLDRDLEKIPSGDVLNQRLNESVCLTRPEISVLLAHCKTYLKSALQLEVGLLTSPLGLAAVEAYFPEKLRSWPGIDLQQHPLYLEIAANCLANRLVNRLGIIFPMQLILEDGYSITQLFEAAGIAHHLVQCEALWEAIEQLDGKVHADLQQQLSMQVRQAVETSIDWVLVNGLTRLPLAKILSEHRENVLQLSEIWSALQPETEITRKLSLRNEYQDAGVSSGLIDGLEELYRWRDRLEIGLLKTAHSELEDVASIYFMLDRRLQIRQLKNCIEELPATGRWQWLARKTLLQDVQQCLQRLTAGVLGKSQGGSPAQRVELWWSSRQGAVDRYRNQLGLVRHGEPQSIESLTVVLSALRHLFAS